MQQRVLLLILILLNQSLYGVNFIGKLHIEKMHPIIKKNQCQLFPKHLSKFSRGHEFLIEVKIIINESQVSKLYDMTKLDWIKTIFKSNNKHYSFLLPLKLFQNPNGEFKKPGDTFVFLTLYDIKSNDKEFDNETNQTESDESNDIQTNELDLNLPFELDQSFEKLDHIFKYYVIQAKNEYDIAQEEYDDLINFNDSEELIYRAKEKLNQAKARYNAILLLIPKDLRDNSNNLSDSISSVASPTSECNLDYPQNEDHEIISHTKSRFLRSQSVEDRVKAKCFRRQSSLGNILDY